MNYSIAPPIESIIDIVVLFLISCGLLIFLTRHCRVVVSRLNFSKLVKREDGAAYPLSLVLAIPFYVLVIATITECALMIVVKVGTMNAAYAAARSAIVWKAAEVSGQQQDEMIHLAAAQAMTPFASSDERHLAATGNAHGSATAATEAYYNAYKTYSGGNAPQDYLARKFRFAQHATDVEIEVDSAPGRDYTSDLRVTVTYEKPIDLPVVGLFLGSRASWGAGSYTRKIKTILVLQKEGPQSDSRKLGINYDSWNF